MGLCHCHIMTQFRTHHCSVEVCRAESVAARWKCAGQRVSLLGGSVQGSECCCSVEVCRETRVAAQ